MLANRDAHERADRIVETTGGRSGSGPLQPRVSVLPVPFLSKIRRDVRQIERKTRPAVDHGDGIADVGQRIRRIRRRLPDGAPERNRVSEPEIALSGRELRLSPDCRVLGGTAEVIEECVQE